MKIIKFILCFIGLHDWESIESCSKWKLLNGVDAHTPVDDVSSYYKNKVCLECGKKVDQIKAFKKRMEEKEKEQTRRKLKAEQMIKS